MAAPLSLMSRGNFRLWISFLFSLSRHCSAAGVAPCEIFVAGISISIPDRVRFRSIPDTRSTCTRRLRTFPIEYRSQRFDGSRVVEANFSEQSARLCPRFYFRSIPKEFWFFGSATVESYICIILGFLDSLSLAKVLILFRKRSSALFSHNRLIEIKAEMTKRSWLMKFIDSFITSICW